MPDEKPPTDKPKAKAATTPPADGGTARATTPAPGAFVAPIVPTDPLGPWRALDALASYEAGIGGPAGPLWRAVANAVRAQLGDASLAVPGAQPRAASLVVAPPVVPRPRADIVGISRAPSQPIPSVAAPIAKTGRERTSVEQPITAARK